MHVLTHLRHGGWGAPHLNSRHSSMPFLEDDSGVRVLDVGSIQAQAQKYYSNLFESPLAEHVKKDAMVTEAPEADQTDNVIAMGCGLTVDIVRRARQSLKVGKTCGTGGFVTEMFRDPDAADWQWTTAFNARIMNAKAEDTVGIIGDTVWDRFGVSLLPKENAPTKFKLLRPIAILLASARLWSRTLFTVLEASDVECSASHLGFRKGHSCVELVSAIRLLQNDVASGASKSALFSSVSPARTIASFTLLYWTPWLAGASCCLWQPHT